MRRAHARRTATTIREVSDIVVTTDERPEGRQRSAEEERLLAQRRRDTRNKWLWRIAGYVVVLLIWEYGFQAIMELIAGRSLNDALLPGPIRILQTIPDIWEDGEMLSNFGATLTRIGIGFGVSFIAGALIGLFTQNKWLDSFFRDLVVVSLTSPGLVWALTGLIIWGFKPLGWIFAIFMTTFALVSVNISEGVRALPKDLLDMAKAFGVSSIDRQRHIVIPHLAPYIFTAVRFGFSIAWKVTVLTEVFSSNKGIGFQMRVTSQVFQLDEFFTWVLSFFVFALFLEKVVLQRAEDRYFRWRQEVAT
ncbi:MAG: ABC transporter permease subunit [Acidimicrobiia bacterium]|nr:ABC transporter permease subunit [Acidimicrobiia bacterium]MDH4305881.1 ABC transporter permease subunit [Acidimicrobiia bacterium]MDH5294321.1 ABC transporter permease subunit [Acidimicrobiia bacterium]